MNDIKGIIEDVEKSSLVSNKVIEKVIEIIGQEEWQDLHDENSDICTTMGELIITLNSITDLEKENAQLKILVSSMLYEINALWDISEMNEDVRKHAEKIDSEVEK